MKLPEWIVGDLTDSYTAYKQRELELKPDTETTLMYERLYDDLNALDTKGGALLQFISLLVTAVTLIISPDIGEPLQGFLKPGPNFLLTLSALSAYLAAGAALMVVQVRWARTRGTAQARAEEIFAVRRSRTAAYGVAWWLAMLSLTLLAAYLIAVNALPPVQVAPQVAPLE